MFPQARKTDYRPQLKHYVVSAEGGVTEREYFNRLKKLFWGRCNITLLGKKTESSPKDVVAHMDAYRGKLIDGDEKWCVIDRDRWTPDQIGELKEWASANDSITRSYAISNPKFELWLVAHFRDLPSAPFGCVQVLKSFMPDYDKHLDERKITEESVLSAISRGKGLTPSGEPPESEFGTNVWVLVERMSQKPPSIELESDSDPALADHDGKMVQEEFDLS